MEVSLSSIDIDRGVRKVIVIITPSEQHPKADSSTRCCTALCIFQTTFLPDTSCRCELLSELPFVFIEFKSIQAYHPRGAYSTQLKYYFMRAKSHALQICQESAAHKQSVN